MNALTRKDCEDAISRLKAELAQLPFLISEAKTDEAMANFEYEKAKRMRMAHEARVAAALLEMENWKERLVRFAGQQ